MPLTIALCQIKVSDCVNESLKSFYNIFSGLARQGVDVQGEKFVMKVIDGEAVRLAEDSSFKIN
jgi:hypothetical protein